VAKTAVVQPDAPQAKLGLVPSKLPELKLPNFDLDALFSVQKANLAAVQEAQSVLVETARAIAKVQQGYVEQSVAEAKAKLASKELLKPQVVLSAVKAAAERTGAVTKEVVDLTVAAQRRVGELFTQRSQASVSELKALAA